MRQVVITRYGKPEVLQLREAVDPTPGDGEIRIAVRASGVNFADVMARLGLYPDAPKPPMVVGYEVAGVVDAVGAGGAGVTDYRVGDRVLAMTRFGGYADRVVVPALFAFPVPDGINDAAAAAIPVNYLTAYLALYRIANLLEGETVLVHGAGGGVGIAATQLARLRGAKVIGTASSAKHEAIRQVGVQHAIDYRDGNLIANVRHITGKRGVDVILDPIGGKSFSDSYRLLAPLGRLIVYGVSSLASGEQRNWLHALVTMLRMPKFGPLSLMNQNRGVFGLNLGHLWREHAQLADAMRAILREVAAGRLQPIVARTFPLEHAADAHRFMQSRSNIGKVVLTT
jgi:NADPH:quinone reductase-like Zn-dependent oxidoreductase